MPDNQRIALVILNAMKDPGLQFFRETPRLRL